jgi:hypothetical protein
MPVVRDPASKSLKRDPTNHGLKIGELFFGMESCCCKACYVCGAPCINLKLDGWPLILDTDGDGTPDTSLDGTWVLPWMGFGCFYGITCQYDDDDPTKTWLLMVALNALFTLGDDGEDHNHLFIERFWYSGFYGTFGHEDNGSGPPATQYGSMAALPGCDQHATVHLATVVGLDGITTAHIAGTANFNSSGTITTLEILSSGSAIFSGDYRAKTVTTIKMYRGATLVYDPAVITITNPIQLIGCGISDVTITTPLGLTVAVVKT